MHELEAKEVLREVLDIISQNLHYLEDSGAERFLNESLPAMYMIERLRDEFLYEDDFDLKEAEYQTEDPVVYLAFLSMSGFEPIEIFASEQEFLNWLGAESALGKEFVDDVQEYDHGLQDRTLDVIASYMNKFKETEE